MAVPMSWIGTEVARTRSSARIVASHWLHWCVCRSVLIDRGRSARGAGAGHAACRGWRRPPPPSVGPARSRRRRGGRSARRAAPTTVFNSGETSWSDLVALGSSVASSTATALSRSVRLRSAEAESDSEGRDVSSVPTACSRPETAWEMPSAARSMPEPALLTPPSRRSSRLMRRSSRSAMSLMASSALSAEVGRRRRAPGKRTIVTSKDGDSTPRIMGDRPSGVQYAVGLPIRGDARRRGAVLPARVGAARTTRAAGAESGPAVSRAQ